MFNKIKNWLRRRDQDRDRDFEILSSKLSYIQNILKGEATDNLILLRHQLGSIDLSDIEDKEMSESERKEYCASICAVFSRLEKDIKKFLYEQLMYSSNQAETWEKVIFGRGTFNGMDILLNHWKKANDEHISNSSPEKYDKHSSIGEI